MCIEVANNYLPSEETVEELKKVRQERDELRRDKEEEVAALNAKLHAMERTYETILQVWCETNHTIFYYCTAMA